MHAVYAILQRSTDSIETHAAVYAHSEHTAEVTWPPGQFAKEDNWSCCSHFMLGKCRLAEHLRRSTGQQGL